MSKYPRYQDYVIANGLFIGEFEQMYRDFDDPWEQSVRESELTVKALVPLLCRKYGCKTVMEIGCGHGHFTKQLADSDLEVTGVDISESAIAKARQLYPGCDFKCADVLDFELYRKIRPDCIILAEVAWYILDKLGVFLDFYRKEFTFEHTHGGGAYLINLLAVYPEGVQQYGKEYFTDLPGILKYFNLDYEEYGIISQKVNSGEVMDRTFFMGKPLSDCEAQ